MAEKNIFRNSSKFCRLSKRRMFHIHQFVICLAEQLKPNGHFSCGGKKKKKAVIFKTSRQSENIHIHLVEEKIHTNYTIKSLYICDICVYIWGATYRKEEAVRRHKLDFPLGFS